MGLLVKVHIHPYLCCIAVMKKFLYLDINECHNIPCHHNCTNTAGSYVCSCNTGYVMGGSVCTGKLFLLLLYVCMRDTCA